MNILDAFLDHRAPDASLIPPLATRRECAVIDVGSNSVRLVLYRIEGRALTPVLNEKTLAGLGRDLALSGILSPTGVDAAMNALRRFRALLEALDIRDITAVATAAVREARDGPDFVARVRREAGFRLQVLTGAEEARFSALGVLAGAPEALGVVGDLGGSSLELVPVEQSGPGLGQTFPLGPLALMGAQKSGAIDVAGLRLDIARVLAGAALAPHPGGLFYAVGGGWRAIAKLDMLLREYPLQVLQHYEIPAARAMELAEAILKPTRKIAQAVASAAGRRSETLPYAALALEGVLRRGGFSAVSVSAFGLREGLLFDQMPALDRRADPLLAGVSAMAQCDGRTLRFCRALDRWAQPALSLAPPAFGGERDAVLAAAAANLADIGSGLHPDHRADIVFNAVLRGAYSGATHGERAFLACALHRRHQRLGGEAANIVRKLLPDAALARAEALGAALRLGAELSGRSAPILSDCRLAASDNAITLHVEAAARDLISDSIERRVTQLGEALGVRGIVAIGQSA